jgi:hypothetical protein
MWEKICPICGEKFGTPNAYAEHEGDCKEIPDWSQPSSLPAPVSSGELQTVQALTYLCLSSCDRNAAQALVLMRVIQQRYPAVSEIFARVGREFKNTCGMTMQ